MSRWSKLIVAVTGLLVAIGTLIGTISMTIGKSPEPGGGVVVILQTPEQYAECFANHPSTGGSPPPIPFLPPVQGGEGGEHSERDPLP